MLAILNSLKVGSINGGDGKWDGRLCDEDVGPLRLLVDKAARELIIFQARTTSRKRDQN